MSDNPPISDEYAAELVSKIQFELASPIPDILEPGSRAQNLLILKLWAKVAALEQATAFMGAGIKPIGRSP